MAKTNVKVLTTPQSIRLKQIRRGCGIDYGTSSLNRFDLRLFRMGLIKFSFRKARHYAWSTNDRSNKPSRILWLTAKAERSLNAYDVKHGLISRVAMGFAPGENPEALRLMTGGAQ